MLCIRFRRIARSTGQKAFGSRVLGIPALTAQNTIIINASGYADIIHTHVHMNLIQRACTHALKWNAGGGGGGGEAAKWA